MPAYITPPKSTESGRTSGSLLTVMDIMPTILERAGVEASAMNPADSGRLPMRGKSFAALLDDPDRQIHDPSEDMPMDHAGWSVMIRGDWKIVREVDASDWQLFNTADDPSEIRDVSAEYPDIFGDMVSKYEEHAAATGNDRNHQRPVRNRVRSHGRAEGWRPAYYRGAICPPYRCDSQVHQLFALR